MDMCALTNVPTLAVGVTVQCSVWIAKISVIKILAWPLVIQSQGKIIIIKLRHVLIASHVSHHRMYQVDSKTCDDCHSECRDSCSGPNSDNCSACANVKDGRFCVNKCPESKYPASGYCLACHDTCVGCRGPRNTIASDGCITCDSAIINGDSKVEKCLKKDDPCPGKTDFYFILLYFFCFMTVVLQMVTTTIGLDRPPMEQSPR